MVSDLLASRKEWGKAAKEGLSAAWPICVGYIAIGLAFGVIARKTGLQPLEVGLMSLLVYAGSSQFIAAAMIADGAGLLSIVLTTFMVNLRHLLMIGKVAGNLYPVDRFAILAPQYSRQLPH